MNVDDLAARFAARTLTKPEWTHRAHLCVGLWHVHHYGAEEASDRLRRDIRLLNDSHGTVNSESSGYHETITLAYLKLLHQFLQRCSPELPLEECAERMLADPIAERRSLLSFYSEGRLMSSEARAGWIEPDIRTIEKPHLIMFDVDGTLVDSMAIEEACFPQACEQALGLKNISRDWSTYRNPSDGGIVGELVQGHLGRLPTADDLRRVEEEFRRLLEEAGPFRPVDGAFAAYLYATGLPNTVVGIATGGWGETARLKLESAGFRIHDRPFGNAYDAISKADIMSACLDRAKIHAQSETFASAIYVGDLPSDATAAAQLGFHFIDVANIGRFPAHVRELQGWGMVRAFRPVSGRSAGVR